MVVALYNFISLNEYAPIYNLDDAEVESPTDYEALEAVLSPLHLKEEKARMLEKRDAIAEVMWEDYRKQ